MRRLPEDLDRWHGSFEADALGRWQFGVVAWVDRVASWQHELERKVAAGQSDLASELAEGAALLGVESLTVEEGLAASRRRSLRADGLRRDPRDPGRFRARLVRVLVRALPALVGRLRRGREAAAGVRQAGLRRALPAARPPDRADAPQGPQQLADRAALRPGQPVGHRRRGGRAHGAEPRARQRGGLRPPDRARRRGRHLHRARPRAQLLARPSLAARASRLVPPPARRHAQVRREPAQALPGHLQHQLRHRGLARALGRAPRGRAALGRAGREGVPRGQPAHQAGAVLGVADRAGAGRPPRDGLPGRGVHATGDDGAAREGRLQPVLHVLHVAQHEERADLVHARPHALGAAAVPPAELLRQHARHPARLPRCGRAPGIRGAARAGGHALARPTASTRASSAARTCR